MVCQLVASTQEHDLPTFKLSHEINFYTVSGRMERDEADRSWRDPPPPSPAPKPLRPAGHSSGRPACASATARTMAPRPRRAHAPTAGPNPSPLYKNRSLSRPPLCPLSDPPLHPPSSRINSVGRNGAVHGEDEQRRVPALLHLRVALRAHRAPEVSNAAARTRRRARRRLLAYGRSRSPPYLVFRRVVSRGD